MPVNKHGYMLVNAVSIKNICKVAYYAAMNQHSSCRRSTTEGIVST